MLHNIHKTLDGDARYVGQQKIPETLLLTEDVIDQGVTDAVNRAAALNDELLFAESNDAVTRGSLLWRPVDRRLQKQVTVRIKLGGGTFSAPSVLSNNNDDRPRVLAIGGKSAVSCLQLRTNLQKCTTDFKELYINIFTDIHFAILRLADRRIFYIDLGSTRGSVEVIRTLGQSDNLFHEIKTVFDMTKKLATLGDSFTTEREFVDLLRGADTEDRSQPLMGIELKSGRSIAAINGD